MPDERYSLGSVRASSPKLDNQESIGLDCSDKSYARGKNTCLLQETGDQRNTASMPSIEQSTVIPGIRKSMHGIEGKAEGKELEGEGGRHERYCAEPSLNALASIHGGTTAISPSTSSRWEAVEDEICAVRTSSPLCSLNRLIIVISMRRNGDALEIGSLRSDPDRAAS